MDLAHLVHAMSAWSREPLLRFFAVGALLYAASALTGARDEGRRIVVPAEYVEALRDELATAKGAPLTPAEAAGATDRLVDEEVLYREALALGLDKGDAAIRNRLVFKMQTLLGDLAALPAPDAAPRAIAPAPRYAFTHVFLAREARGARMAEDGRALAARLTDATPEQGPALGDAFFAGASWPSASAAELAAVFGATLAERALAAPSGGWSGPIESPFGLHFVWRSDALPVDPAAIARAEAEAERVRLEAARARAVADALAQLRARYRVELEAPELAAVTP